MLGRRRGSFCIIMVWVEERNVNQLLWRIGQIIDNGRFSRARWSGSRLKRRNWIGEKSRSAPRRSVYRVGFFFDDG